MVGAGWTAAGGNAHPAARRRQQLHRALCRPSLSLPPVSCVTYPCDWGCGLAVFEKRDVIVVAGPSDDVDGNGVGYCHQLFVYTLSTGSFVTSFGCRGTATLEFGCHYGGLCTSPRDTLLVAEFFNDRVQEVALWDDVDCDGHGDDRRQTVGRYAWCVVSPPPFPP